MFDLVMQYLTGLCLGYALAYGYDHFLRPWFRQSTAGEKMSDHLFDAKNRRHVLQLSKNIHDLLNAERSNGRFALVLWEEGADQIEGFVSNDQELSHVLEMLDDAKLRISTPPDAIHPTTGHA